MQQLQLHPQLQHLLGSKHCLLLGCHQQKDRGAPRGLCLLLLLLLLGNCRQGSSSLTYQLLAQTVVRLSIAATLAATWAVSLAAVLATAQAACRCCCKVGGVVTCRAQ